MGKTLISYLIAHNNKNIILIAPYRDLLLQLIDRYNIYSNKSYNNTLL